MQLVCCCVLHGCRRMAGGVICVASCGVHANWDVHKRMHAAHLTSAILICLRMAVSQPQRAPHIHPHMVQGSSGRCSKSP